MQKKPEERDPAELELATMRQCRKLLMRLNMAGRLRAVAYLQSALQPNAAPPADPKQPQLFP